MGIETDVVNAVLINCETLLASLYPLKMPGRVFTPPNDQKYIEVIMLPNDTGETWGSDKTFQGFVRVILHWPLDDEGIIPPTAVQETIVSLFPKGKVLSSGLANLQIYDVPTRLGDVSGGHETLFPVSFPYRQFYSPAS